MKPGDSLSLGLPVELDGSYQISIYLARRGDEIRVNNLRFFLDARGLGEPVESLGGPSPLLSLGVHDVRSGVRCFTIAAGERSRQSGQDLSFGLRCIRLERLD